MNVEYVEFRLCCADRATMQLRRPSRPNPMACTRCGKPRGWRPPGESCCDWRGRYRGRHRKARR